MRRVFPFLFIAVILFCWSCEEDKQPVQVYMDIDVTDIEGNDVEMYPLTPENLDIDTLLRSEKIRYKSGDSIVLSKDAIDLMFHLTTNATWRTTKKKPWGNNKESLTWLSNPKPDFGGGNSTFITTVKENTGTTSKPAADRRLYVYISTGDSSCVKKYVFMQKK